MHTYIKYFLEVFYFEKISASTMGFAASIHDDDLAYVRPARQYIR